MKKQKLQFTLLISGCGGITFLLLGMEAMEIEGTALRQPLWVLLLVLWGILLFQSIRIFAAAEQIQQQAGRILSGNENARIYVHDRGMMAELSQTVNDILELLQKTSIERQRSEESQKRLLSNISHDMRTPLTSILGYLEALRDGVAESPEERQEYLDIVFSKARYLKNLVSEIFYMAKLDAEDLPLHPVPCDLSELLRECIIDFLPELQRQQMKLQVEIPEAYQSVYIDRMSIIRVCSNLLKNAIQHGKAGGIIGIQLVSEEKDYIVHVWDKGPGIETEHLSRLFDRLYRVDQARNSAAGSGLGLAIAKKLLEKQGGKIWVESVPFEKTVFSFSLPRS